MNLKPLYLAEREILNNTLYRDPRQEFPPFEVNYFVTSFKHNSTLQYHIIWPNEVSKCIDSHITQDIYSQREQLQMLHQGFHRFVQVDETASRPLNFSFYT